MTDTYELAGLLETLCPMFLLVEQDGRIQQAGPTLQKLRPELPLIGQGFLEVFELIRPRTVTTIPALLSMAGAKLHLKFKDEPRTPLKGLVAPLPRSGGAVINLSFGISILDAVRDYALTSADFSGTDLAIELLYLVEAKSAAMEASRSLNLRLQGAMLAAEEQAYTDTLTGLKNRRAMDHVLANLISSNSTFALMHLDLDFFKSVNDSLGHAAGDFVLQQAARIMIEETRSEDTVARVGGDEFVIVFKDLTRDDRLKAIADRLIQRLNEPMMFQNQHCTVSASIGTALSTQFQVPKAADILHAADLALYQAKRDGRSCHRLYSTLSKAQS
ncbi:MULTISPECIES: GGDEF domain-containing protein [unclassified Ruegeria]|uniref:GGDEF domain-containing protein n=1 Tax=unclassified Ruegeria TaxID=2625375 RepID=UPI0014922201|nr:MULTISPECIES: GGDEF domain-containing protein [unclassified Ruegeria]NOD86803.1 diguanylate cyclase [Ruegeria sp. HKCCD4318]NOE12358.1 diguanylate cyclase [Ruegeria sp. HKCCD4318-2]NOG09477.1 GGDEF domain-containing protein [Ruegeria sp. HKCCD4315]